jgi:ubiquitin related modifier 1
MELLFDNVRHHTIEQPAQSSDNQPITLKDLILYIRDNMMTEKKELFVEKDTVYAKSSGLYNFQRKICTD